MQDFSQSGSRTNGRWTKEEHLKFLEGLRIYGKNWKKIEQLVQTRSGSQIRSHAQKFFLKTNLPSANAPSCEPSSPEADCGEEASGGSKTMQEWAGQRQQLSYYLCRIMDFSSGGEHLDFWTTLVDCRGATDNLNHSIRNSSFVGFEEDENSAETLSLPAKQTPP